MLSACLRWGEGGCEAITNGKAGHPRGGGSHRCCSEIQSAEQLAVMHNAVGFRLWPSCHGRPIFMTKGGVGERQKGRSNTLRGVQEGVSNKISEASGNTHVLRVSIAAEELVQPRNRLLSRRVLWRRPPAGEFGGASLSRIFEEGCGAVRRGQSINVDDFWEPGDAK